MISIHSKYPAGFVFMYFRHHSDTYSTYKYGVHSTFLPVVSLSTSLYL